MTRASSLLIVDDNSDLVSVCGEFLTDCGFRVLKAFSGSEAVELCAGDAGAVGLAIVDLNMPELDGPSTIDALKQSSPALRVIVISGAMLVPYFAKLNDLGVRDFLPKPFELDGLLESIRFATN
jgi:DNA-binding NtrC family response regulator